MEFTDIIYSARIAQEILMYKSSRETQKKKEFAGDISTVG